MDTLTIKLNTIKEKRQKTLEDIEKKYSEIENKELKLLVEQHGEKQKVYKEWFQDYTLITAELEANFDQLNEKYDVIVENINKMEQKLNDLDNILTDMKEELYRQLNDSGVDNSLAIEDLQEKWNELRTDHEDAKRQMEEHARDFAMVKLFLNELRLHIWELTQKFTTFESDLEIIAQAN